MGISRSKRVHIGTVEGDPIHTLAVYLANLAESDLVDGQVARIMRQFDS